MTLCKTLTSENMEQTRLQNFNHKILRLFNFLLTGIVTFVPPNGGVAKTNSRARLEKDGEPTNRRADSGLE